MIKIGIIGLGLIGASILKKLYNNCQYEIFCCSKSSFENALNYTKNSALNLEIVKGCDVVFVCSKISKTLEILEKLNSFLDKKTIVLDVSSIKKGLLNQKYNFNFVLSHPMAGSEKNGFEAGDVELFKGAKWLIDKKFSNESAKSEIIEKIIKDLGAIPFWIDMKDHDNFCAQISHLPTILSFLLFDLATNEAKQIASSGFRDCTRLAMSESDMVLNMLNLNEENILNLFDKLQEKLIYLKNLSNSEKIKIFKEIAANRQKMYDVNGKNIFKIQGN